MKIIGIGRLAPLAGTGVLAALTGCVTQPRPLYHWGEYQPQVYSYLKGDGASEVAQLGKLEADAQRAQAKGEALPPGFNAHLGLLYLKAGQGAKAMAAFQTEEAQFPESKPYMDFLMRDKAPLATPVSAPAAAETAPNATVVPAVPAPPKAPAIAPAKAATASNKVSDAR